MKSTFHRILLFLALALGLAADEVDREICLGGIIRRESRGNPYAVGPLGERSVYQFRRSTWAMETDVSFRLAHTEHAHDVAIAHYNRIVRVFESSGIPVTEFNIALAWNAGIAGVLRGNIPASSYRYAADVCRFADDIRAERERMTPKFILEVSPTSTAPTVSTRSPILQASATVPVKFDLSTRPLLAVSTQPFRVN